jgi:AcrR family transcriptional regulator
MTELDIARRKWPRQRRAAFTVDVVLEAATRVLAAGGLARFTTNRVAEVAGVSVGSVYQYFPNKEALIAALIERAQQAFVAEVEQLVAATATASLDDSLRAFAVLAVRQQYQQPSLAAALDAEEARLPVQSVLDDSERRICAAIEILAARHGHPDPRTAARHLFIMTKALVEADVGRSQAAAARPRGSTAARAGWLPCR